MTFLSRFYCICLDTLFIVFLLYHTKWYYALLHATIVTIVVSSTELIVLNSILHYVTDFYAEISYFRNLALLALFSKLLYYLILYTISHLIKKRQIQVSRIDHGTEMLIIIPIISISISVTLFAICMNTQLSVIQDWLISLDTVLVLGINMLIFHYFDYIQRMNSQYTDIQSQLQKEKDNTEYYRLFSEHDKTKDILIHDIKNHLYSNKNFNANRDYQKIEEYISSLVSSSELNTTMDICDNRLLNSIICRYQTLCMDKNINFKTDIRTNTVDFLKDEEITSIFSNLLDNAIEAVKDIEDSFIDLNVTKKEGTSLVIIKMINSCMDAHVKVHNKVFLTHKANSKRHGLGLKA